MSRPRMTPELAEEKARKDFQMEVKLQRVRLDMTQKELGLQIGVVPSAMSELLANPDKLSVARLRGIVKALDMDPATILRLLGFDNKIISRLSDATAGAVIPMRRVQ